MLRRTCRTLCEGGGKVTLDEKRRLKAEMKIREMGRKRSEKGYESSVGISSGMKLAQARGSSKKGWRPKVATVGVNNWAAELWHGKRSRGGGLKSWVASLIKVVSMVTVLGVPIFIFFYDDGKSAFLTRVLLVKEFENTQRPVILDVGTGNAVLTGMIALETYDKDGSITTIDKDTAAYNSAVKLFSQKRFSNVTPMNLDVLDLKNLDKKFTHSVISMCLHELDPKRRIAIVEEMAKKTHDGKILVLDFTPKAYGFWNLSQFRNTVMEFQSGHYGNFKTWVASGGMEGLVEEIETARKDGLLAIPQLTISKVEYEDRDTHAVYTIDVGTM
eukprot:TRINITY_DN18949_c0_g1_i1.p1 TRINITY_DN18949_c0_g1~~TRINITY_DN18949_c0_g1_i1.p1  ORF type:complete len:345 (+),score=67.37 TRINITY_DN18949_c0_g1_i1:46-1035(+)